MGTVGGSLTTNPLGGWLTSDPADPSPTVAVHLRGRAKIPPYCGSHSSTGGVDGCDTARCSRATRLALVALKVGLTRPLPLSFLSSNYCSHRCCDNICPTSYLHGASNGRCLIVRLSPLPICARHNWVLHWSPRPDGGPVLVGLWEGSKGTKLGSGAVDGQRSATLR